METESDIMAKIKTIQINLRIAEIPNKRPPMMKR